MEFGHPRPCSDPVSNMCRAQMEQLNPPSGSILAGWTRASRTLIEASTENLLPFIPAHVRGHSCLRATG
eukprot:2123029-Pyramimonas_sp.AAC.1